MKLALQLGQIKQIIGEGTSTLDDSFVVNTIASLERACPQDLAVIFERGDASVFDNISSKVIEQSGAGLFLAAQKPVDNKQYLLVSDPLQAFQKLVTYIQNKDRVSNEARSLFSDVQLDPSAVVASGASIGAGSVISALVYIGRNCQIGKGVLVHPGVRILDGSIIGDGSIIHAGAVIGSDGFGYQMGKQGLRKVPQIGIVRIGREVEIGANSTIDRGSFDETVIEDMVKLDNCVHVAHNVRIGAGTVILPFTALGGSATVGIGCQIGALVAIRDHIKVGNRVKIVSKSGIMNDVADGSVVAGMPAVAFGTWKRLVVLLTKLPELFKMANEVQKVIEHQKKPFWKKFFS
ncbi:UDP-3-O-(3-hydroxymyristoyl)glucosamine N-acyltransferase [Candidatus Babeliales bacterium]|nr:UDP-3-O-(3-hydroxymyristoyl)glucosamine N-acyltransferase [Candidatus Babeliales bacterium]